MPSLDTYKKIKGNVKTIGEIHKNQSDMVIEATWNNDINSKIAWFYDQDRDDEYELSDDLHPYKSQTKIPIEIKFYEIEYNSLSKDETGMHIMFKPSFNYQEAVPYYDKEYRDIVDSIWPIGMYMDCADSEGIYHRYLVVGQYRHYANQFPSYIVLPCDFKLRWVMKQQKYSTWGVLRSQSSYNSGVWQDYRIQTIENQKLFWMPYSFINAEIFYDTRCAISSPRKEPVCWSVSKVEDMNVKGIIRLTFKQDKFNKNTDVIEYDNNNNYITTWCNLKKDGVPIEEEQHTLIPLSLVHSVITYSGIKPDIKVNGSGKKFIVKFYNDEYNKNEIPVPEGRWNFTICENNEDASSLIEYEDITPEGEKYYKQIRVKFIGSDENINKDLYVWYISDTGIKTFVTVNIVGL